MAKKQGKKTKGKPQSKVLVVEDDLTLLETLEYNLARQEYAVYKATDGRSALRVARQELPETMAVRLPSASVMVNLTMSPAGFFGTGADLFSARTASTFVPRERCFSTDTTAVCRQVA